MADDTTTPGSETQTGADLTDPQDPAVQDPSTTPGQDPATDEFDKERAMSTIRKLREEAKAATRQLKELEQLRQERKAREDAELSEKERLSNRATDLEKQLSQREAALRDLETRHTIERHAAKLGIVDPDAAVRLLDLEYGDDGKPVDLEGALKTLIEDKPYLVRSEQPQQRATGSPTNPATRNAPAGTKRWTTAEIADRPTYLANEADILKAMREGRVD